MFDFVTPLLAWLNNNPEWAGFVTFIISASESVAIIGTIVPGSITMTALGALAGAGVIPLWETLFFATLGAIAGDGISYWLGHYFKDRLRGMWPFKQNPGILERGEKFVHKYGLMSVFIGRFIGPVRALVPLVAGMLGMRPLQFTVANVLSAIGWAPAYLLPGLLLGAASMELPPDIAVNVMLALLLILLFISLCIWFLYKLFMLIRVRIENLENYIWNWFKTHRIGKPVTVWLAHHNHTKKRGQFSLALLFLFGLISTLFVMINVKIIGASHLNLNLIIHNFFRSIRGVRLDNCALYITLIGQKEILFTALGAIIVLLLVRKRFRLATHFALLLALTAASVFILKNTFQSLRPWGILQSPDSFSMPSGHATVSFTILLAIAYFSTKQMSKIKRMLIYVPTCILIFFIGISRLYLGAHWFTDIISGWFLGLTILTFVIISFERHTEKPVNGAQLFSVFYCFVFLIILFFSQINWTHLKTNYTKMSWPTSQIDEKSWWEGGDSLAKERTSLFGFASQHINIHWAGDLENIEKQLKQSGWTNPPVRNFISTLHRIADISSTQFLPMISPQYLDEKPKLVLSKKTAKNGLLVIRLWNSHREFESNHKMITIWVGVISKVPRSYSWLFGNSRKEVEINPNFIFDNLHKTDGWEWKMITVPEKSTNNLTIKTMMLRHK